MHAFICIFADAQDFIENKKLPANGMIKADVVASPFRNVVEISDNHYNKEHIKNILEKKNFGRLIVKEVKEFKEKLYAVFNSEHGL